MRIGILAAVLSVTLVAGAVPVVAHHAFSAEFDKDKPVTVTGSIVKVEWVNPHSWLWVEVRGEDGTVVQWSFEMGAPAWMLRHGWKKDDVKPGIVVTVSGYRAWSGKLVANASAVKLPDGRNLFSPNAGDQR